MTLSQILALFDAKFTHFELDETPVTIRTLARLNLTGDGVGSRADYDIEHLQIRAIREDGGVSQSYEPILRKKTPRAGGAATYHFVSEIDSAAVNALADI